MRSWSNMRWLLVASGCFVAFICMLGVANAAQNNGSAAPTLAQKMQGAQQMLIDGRAHTHTKPVNQNQAPAVQPTPVRQVGILNIGQGPFPQSTFAVYNFWQGPVGNDWVLAYAGVKMNANGTAGLGGIVLYTETVNDQGGVDLHPLGTFLAPNGTTALTITARQGNLLLLHSKVGQQLAFNLVSHQFQ
jgi:hypothetical protein